MMSKTICAAPWTHLHTWPNDDVYPCCLTDMKDTVGNLNSEIEKNLSPKKIKYFFETLNCIKAIAQEFEHFTPTILKAI